MRHRIFVGSSTEDLTLANAIQLNLSRQGHTVKVWDQGVFAVGKNILEGLIHALDDYDAAVFVFAPNDLVSIRGQHFDAVRDNVVFELGLFTGKLGRDRTFWVVPQGQKQLRLASDLLGVVPAEYVEPRDGDWVNALSVACLKVHHALIESARRRGSDHPRCRTAPWRPAGRASTTS
jgi:predicted nucleotide-binding protein